MRSRTFGRHRREAGAARGGNDELQSHLFADTIFELKSHGDYVNGGFRIYAAVLCRRRPPRNHAIFAIMPSRGIGTAADRARRPIGGGTAPDWRSTSPRVREN